MKKPKKYMTITEAMAYAKEHNINYTRPTIIRYVQKHKMGHQIGKNSSKIFVDIFKFKRWIHGADEKGNKMHLGPGSKKRFEINSGQNSKNNNE